MDNEISYEEAGRSTDVDTLVEYCKQGALENNRINDRTLADWEDGAHLVETYLDHNNIAPATVLEIVAQQLSAWLKSERA